jgi:RNA polymerase sigma-70 factor (ECF subfamily)
MAMTTVKPKDSTDQHSLAYAYQPGNEGDFERLYHASYGKILGTLTAILGDRAAAEDCCQDAFERAFRNWSSWRPEAPAEAWVHRIAINASISYQRKMRLREVGEVIRRLGRPELVPDPQDLVDQRSLAEALTKLPPKQAAAIVLRHYHGYTNRAIARSLGVPERTVASRLAASKERMRGMLRDSFELRADSIERVPAQMGSSTTTYRGAPEAA